MFKNLVISILIIIFRVKNTNFNTYYSMETENIPIITIDLKPELHDFLLHEFGEDENGAIKIHRRSDIGRYIDSMWVLSDLPVKRKFEKYNNPVNLILPLADNSKYIVRNNFLYFPLYREQQINDYLEAVWNNVIREYFIIGYEKGYKQSLIIDAILKAFNIKKNALSFERIKKKDYRKRENLINSVVNEIKSAIIQ